MAQIQFVAVGCLTSINQPALDVIPIELNSLEQCQQRCFELGYNYLGLQSNASSTSPCVCLKYGLSAFYDNDNQKYNSVCQACDEDNFTWSLCGSKTASSQSFFVFYVHKGNEIVSNLELKKNPIVKAASYFSNSVDNNAFQTIQNLKQHYNSGNYTPTLTYEINLPGTTIASIEISSIVFIILLVVIGWRRHSMNTNKY